MNRTRTHYVDPNLAYPGRQQQLRDINKEASDMPQLEGVHQGVILSDTWGNEWDDTDDFGEIDFRLVDGI